MKYYNLIVPHENHNPATGPNSYYSCTGIAEYLWLYAAQAELVQRREQEIRSQNNMTYTNIQSYTFVCGRFDDFILKPQVDHDIKF